MLTALSSEDTYLINEVHHISPLGKPGYVSKVTTSLKQIHIYTLDHVVKWFIQRQLYQ